MKQLFILLLLCAAAPAFSQDWPVKQLITAKKAGKTIFKNIPAFSFIADKSIPQRGIYQQLRLNGNFRSQLMQERPEAIELNIPLGAGKTFTCSLVKFSLGYIKYTENNGDIIDNVRIPVSYRGVVEGETGRNNVTLCVNDDYVSLVAVLQNQTLQVTKADETDKSLYRLYNSAKIEFPVTTLDCGTKSILKNETANGIDLTGNKETAPLAENDKCVNVFVDCFDSLYIWCSSNRQQTINYVYELFTGVTTAYLNERINIQITTINIWTTADPYRADTRENALYDLAAQWQDNFWGNICVGLDYSASRRNRSGIADAIGKVKGTAANICPAYSHEGTDSISACCYNELNYVGYSTSNFPTGPNTTGAQVYLVTHEIGHLLGSSHTQWCGWKLTSNPDTYGTLDNCAPPENGDSTCIVGPAPSSGGGTIMSYCTSGTGGSFINFNNGFGPMPGAKIRSFVGQNTCIPLCVDCYGVRPGNSNKEYAHSFFLKKETDAAGGNKAQKSYPATSILPTAFINPSQKAKR